MLSLLSEKTIHKEIECGRTWLRSLATHPEMGAHAPLTYIFSLLPEDSAIPYPKGPGRTIYIGETQRKTGSWRRFEHISPNLESGLSTLINHTISAYYHAGKALKLRIFKVDNAFTTLAAERHLLTSHLYTFGAYPLGQGTTGGGNTPQRVAERCLAEPALHSQCVQLLGGAL